MTNYEDAPPADKQLFLQGYTVARKAALTERIIRHGLVLLVYTQLIG